MTAINNLVVEALTQPIRNFMHDVKHDPDRALSTSINLGSLAAAIYHIYSKTKDQDDKIAAVFNAIPAAAGKALAVAMAGHAISDLSRGRYSYDPNKNKYMNSGPFKYNPGPVNPNDMQRLQHFQNLTHQQQQQTVNHLMNNGNQHA